MFKSKLFRLIVILISLVMVVGLSRGLYALWNKKDIVSERQEALRKLERENQELQKKLEEAKSPEFIERMARDNLGLIKEGETIVLMPNLPAQAGDQKEEENLPNWKKWWQLFF